MARKPLPPVPPQPLPRNRQALELLLHRVDQVLRLLEPVHQRQKRRLQMIRKCLVEPRSILRNVSEARQSHLASQTQFAIGAMSPGPLKPFVDWPRLKAALDRFKQSMAPVPRVESKPDPSDAIGRWADRFEQRLAAEQEIIEVHQELQARLIKALETCADSADNEADSLELTKRIPQNPKVLRLAALINRERKKGESQRSIALQLTDGDEAVANGLLRQLRRFPHLLQRRSK